MGNQIPEGKGFGGCGVHRGTCTGKSLSDALILASTNPQYDNDCSLNYEFSTWKLQAQNMSRTCCLHKLFRCHKFKV